MTTDASLPAGTRVRDADHPEREGTVARPAVQPGCVVVRWDERLGPPGSAGDGQARHWTGPDAQPWETVEHPARLEECDRHPVYGPKRPDLEPLLSPRPDTVPLAEYRDMERRETAWRTTAGVLGGVAPQDALADVFREQLGFLADAGALDADGRLTSYADLAAEVRELRDALELAGRVMCLHCMRTDHTNAQHAAMAEGGAAPPKKPPHPPCLRETPACWTVEGATIRETRMPCVRPAGHPGFCCACTPTGYEAEDEAFVRGLEAP